MKPTRFIAILGFAAVLPLTAQNIQINKDNKTIAITTTGDASALADQAVVSIGFNSYGKDQDSTYADATRISNTIITALTDAGISKEAIQSTEQALTALDANSNEDKIRFTQGLRFHFYQGWRVTLAADQAANVLHLAITSGANNSGAIDWQLKNDDAIQAEAASKALEHARQIADRMAKGLGAKLGTLMYASNQAPPRGFAMGYGAGMASMIISKKENLKPLAISPNRITRTATVYAVFAIEEPPLR